MKDRGGEPCYSEDAMERQSPSDPLLTRFRAAVTATGLSAWCCSALARAARRSRILITTSQFFCARWAIGFTEMNRLADLSTAILYDTGEFIHAMPYRAGSYNERTPLMHDIRAEGIDL